MTKKAQSRSGRGEKRFKPPPQGPRANPSSARSPDLASAFDRAVALHQAGRLPEAEELYRAILNVKPDDFDCLHLIGVIYHQCGDHEEAVRHIDVALKINPRFAAAHNNRGNALGELQRIVEALASYDNAIAVEPAYVEAWVNRGITLAQLGRFDEALASYDKVAILRTTDAAIWYNRGNALKELCRFTEAVASYDRAIALKSHYAVAFYNRGNALAALERFGEAVASYDRVIALKPDYAEAFNNRGNALAAQKRFDAAVASYDMAIARKPGHAAAWINRGLALYGLKRFDEALTSYDQAIAIRPGDAAAFNNRGNALQAKKLFAEAVASYDQAIALAGDDAEAFSNRGNALRELKLLDEALASCDRAIEIRPGYAEAWINRAIVLGELKQCDEALAGYDRAIALKPDEARAFYNRGNTLKELKRFEEALKDYDRAISLKPDFADVFDNRGAVLAELARFNEAVASYNHAIALAPNHKFAFGGLADCAIRQCDWTRRDALSDALRRHVIDGTSRISPLLLLGYSDDAALHRSCARHYVLDRFGTAPQRLVSRTVQRNDKIRLAYLSSDFRRHAVAYLVAELFELHDRTQFEVFGLSFGADDGSDMRTRLMAAFDRFIDVRTQGDREVAKLLNDLHIDIAIDLNGHTQDERLGILAFRPAPIQVNYLGYPGTSGADFIDYIIADATVLPFEEQPHYTERIVHLPDCYQANDRKRRIAPRTPTREEVGLPAAGFVFCCFNNTWKIAPPVFDVWMRLLKAVEGSALWLYRDNAHAEANLRKEAAARGIDPSRLVFAPPLPHGDHLARHRIADLFLDTLPYNAHTTASDALWAGLPVLTCQGEAFAGRVAASLLTAVGLSDLVTQSLDEYESLALSLATDAPLLTGFRQELERNRLEFPLFDSDRFCRHIERAYTTMWELWQRSEKPRSFSIAPRGGEVILRSEGYNLQLD
jgi:predicted O-linked N-acetylglucosamine transferase (SPINDLY family)